MTEILGSFKTPLTAVNEVDAAILVTGLSVVVCTYMRPGSLRRFLESAATQDRKPNQLIIVDGSPSDEAELMLRNYAGVENLADRLLYFRVSDALKGLTRQRNFAMRWVTTDLVAFFDDDIVLLPNCLRELEKAYRLSGDQVVGVGAFVENEYERPPFRWRLRLILRLVPNLQPGTYCRSGILLPWGFLAPTEALTEGDWLNGCAMMWRTAVAREVGFNELYGGYGSGEDLEFSLEMASKGKLLLTGKSRVLHLKENHGRPSAYELGYMSISNAYDIHRHCLPDRTWKDIAWFFYAHGLDSLIISTKLIWPRGTHERWQYVKGRLSFFNQLLRKAAHTGGSEF